MEPITLADAAQAVRDQAQQAGFRLLVTMASLITREPDPKLHPYEAELIRKYAREWGIGVVPKP